MGLYHLHQQGVTKGPNQSVEFLFSFSLMASRSPFTQVSTPHFFGCFPLQVSAISQDWEGLTKVQMIELSLHYRLVLIFENLHL